MAKGGTKRVLEYACLAMGFANVRASRYGIRSCSGGYSSTNAGAGAGHAPASIVLTEGLATDLGLGACDTCHSSQRTPCSQLTSVGAQLDGKEGDRTLEGKQGNPLKH